MLSSSWRTLKPLGLVHIVSSILKMSDFFRVATFGCKNILGRLNAPLPWTPSRQEVFRMVRDRYGTVRSVGHTIVKWGLGLFQMGPDAFGRKRVPGGAWDLAGAVRRIWS